MHQHLSEGQAISQQVDQDLEWFVIPDDSLNGDVALRKLRNGIQFHVQMFSYQYASLQMSDVYECFIQSTVLIKFI